MLKNLICTLVFCLFSTTFALASSDGYKNITSNSTLTKNQYNTASKIILELNKETAKHFTENCGPFSAAIYDENGNLITKAQNTVIPDTDCTNHAEMNAIRLAQKKLNTYDLSKYNLSIYVTAEPCIMCLGGIMWSGIKNVYFGVYSKDVEKITGFDEGFKPNWQEEFKSRGINVYGGIQQEYGKKVLAEYVKQGNTVYKPQRCRGEH